MLNTIQITGKRGEMMKKFYILLKIDTCMQGLKNPLVRGPGPAICGFGPNIF